MVTKISTAAVKQFRKNVFKRHEMLRINQVREIIFDRIVKDPTHFAVELLAAAKRLEKKRADMRRWKKTELARKSRKKRRH